MAIKKSTYLESEKVIIEVSQELNDKRYLKKEDKASTASGADSLTTSRNIITNLESTIAGSFKGTSSIQAGVTGTLPVSKGGTGQNALYAIKGVGSAFAVANTVTGVNSTDLLYSKVADSDYFRLRVGDTAANAGQAEIATADDYNESVYIRQYSGEFATLKRIAALFDANGNTAFPSTIFPAGVSLSGGLLGASVSVSSGFTSGGTIKGAAVSVSVSVSAVNVNATNLIILRRLQMQTALFVLILILKTMCQLRVCGLSKNFKPFVR